MAIIEINKLKKEFKDILLFEDVSFSINYKERVALIGNNGAGKTTLVKMILGLEDKDYGSINIAGGVTIGYLSQGILSDLRLSLYDEMLDSFKEIVNLKKKLEDITIKLEKEYNDELLKEYGKIETMVTLQNGYSLDYQIDNMLFRFGFKKEDYHRPLSTFSGGEKAKIAFARLLLDKPSLLILDEPTNHLDMTTIEWLEDYLLDYQGAILLISHDRFFIDCVCNKVVEIDNKTTSLYSGNYSYYLQQKTLRYEQELLAYNLQQKEIKKLQELIARFKPHPTKVNFAKDREKKLARIDRIDKPTINHKKVKFTLKDEEVREVKQLTLKDIIIGYPGNELIKVFTDTIYGGDKIAIIGDNGTGKSTLIKSIIAKLPLIAGKIIKHRDIVFGYYDQNQITVDSNYSVFDDFHNAFPLMDNFTIRSQLAKFLFFEDDIDKNVQSLSGGEKAKLSFAKLLTRKYDILILDEPTNHLDMETKKVLEDALIDYQGTVLIVSHDRYFIDAIAKKLYFINNKELITFIGNYSLYRLNKIEDIIIKNNEESIKKKNSTGSKISIGKLENLLKQKQEQLDKLNNEYHDENNCLNHLLLEELHSKIIILEEEIKGLEEQYFELLED